jgi:hypothetical protein
MSRHCFVHIKLQGSGRRSVIRSVYKEGEYQIVDANKSERAKTERQQCQTVLERAKNIYKYIAYLTF